MAKGGQTPQDPTSPEMAAAWKRMERGDVAGARREARRILEANPSAEDRAQAEELLRRTQTPPAVYAFGALVLALLLLLIALALSRY
ncbi:MAG: molecular chaperone DnaJ [Myxococcaceae bacterium]|nr:molecular chaperone DnaJ [Myxococcaceae bacterium]